MAMLLGFALDTNAAVPPQPQIDVTGYVIHVDPAKGRMSATSAVTFTALQDVSVVIFGFNSALHVVSVRDISQASFNCVGNAPNSTITVTSPSMISKGSSVTWTFTYAGSPTLASSPVIGMDFVQIHDPVSALLYAGQWFPVALPGLFTHRFTAEIHATVPSGEIVVGSGATSDRGHELGDGRTQFDFSWNNAGFPGSLIAGKLLPPITAPAAANVRVYLTLQNQARGPEIASTVAQELASMDGEFGRAEPRQVAVVELPDDSVSAAWAPGIVAIKPSHASARLLANTVAHQWWGSEVSPATLADAWITNGMSRYAELMYLEETTGKSAFDSAVTDVEAGALAYDSEPLRSLQSNPFSPQFQSMTLEKGAMIFRMLRWEMGEAVFAQFLQALVKQYADKGVSTPEVEALAEDISKLPLTAFFSQWLDGNGAPEYTNSYGVFRLGGDKGFRIEGSLSQDLDIFSMPVQLRVETEGKRMDRRVDVSGRTVQYSIETVGRPKKIIVDPDNWLLKSTPALTIRTDILLGQQALVQGDPGAAIAAYQKALAVDRGSSLANYRST